MPHTMHAQAGDVGPAEYLDAFDISSSAGDTSIYFGSFVIGAAAIPSESLAAVGSSRKLRRIVTFGNQMKGHLIAELMATQSILERQDTLSYISLILGNRGQPALELPTAAQVQAVADALAQRQPTPGNRPQSAAHAAPAAVVAASGSALTQAVPPVAPPSGLANGGAPAADPAALPAAPAPAAPAVRAPTPRVPHQVGASR